MRLISRGTPPDALKIVGDVAVGELNVAAAFARDIQPVAHVLANMVKPERSQPPNRNTLIDLAAAAASDAPSAADQRGQPASKFLPLLEVGEDPDFFEQRQRQVFCLVDDDDGEGLQRDERIEELVERVADDRGERRRTGCRASGR